VFVQSKVKDPARHAKTGLKAHCLHSDDFRLAGDGGNSTIGAVVWDRNVARNHIAGDQRSFEETVESPTAQVFGPGLHRSNGCA
jgi:hypothetical protein